MFALIITLVSIALVVALVAATVYYGGDSSNKAAIKASASTLINQASQINAAGTVAISAGSDWPADSPQFAQPYLAAMPVPPKSAYAAGLPAPLATDWAYYLNDKSSHHFVLRDKIRADVCMAVNKESGLIGIPAAWDGTSLVQCFGPGATPAGATEAAYTFFYDPVSTTAAQKTAATIQSVNEAIDAGVSGAVPGYPRLCPDGSSITTGVCTGEPAAASDGSGASPAVEGFWVVRADAPGGWDQWPTLVNLGFQTSCPSGAIDPTGPSATPISGLPAEELVNSDGSLQMEWVTDPDGTPDAALKQRTWCIPAMSGDVVDPAALPVLADTNEYGYIQDAALAVAPLGTEPRYSSYVASNIVEISAKGTVWTLAAISFEADVLAPGATDTFPWLVGTKLAIGRAEGVTSTYYADGPTAVVLGETYAGGSGRIEFTAPSRVPTPGLAPQGTGISRTTFYTPQFGNNNDFYILGQPLTDALSVELCPVGDRTDCTWAYIDASGSTDGQILVHGFSDGGFNAPPGAYEMVVSSGAGGEKVYPVTLAPKPSTIVDVVFQGGFSTAQTFSPADELLLVNSPDLVPAACAGESGFSAINVCIGNQVQQTIGGTCSVSGGTVAPGIAAMYPTAVDEVFLTCTGSDPTKLNQVVWWFNGAIQVAYTPGVLPFEPVTSPLSHVTFYGATSTQYLRNPPNDLPLTATPSSNCSGDSRIWAQNICVKNEVQTALGGTCTVTGGVAAPAVVTQNPAAVDEVFLTCTGIDASRVSSVAGQFNGNSQGGFAPEPALVPPSTNGVAYTLDGVTVKFATSPDAVPAGGRLVTFSKAHLEGGYQPNKLGVTQFVDPPGTYNGSYYPNGWAYEIAITGYI